MKLIPLTKGRVALVDDQDYAELSKYSWCVDSKGYVKRVEVGEDGRSHAVAMHRQVMGCTRGDGRQIDHANLNRLDNRRKNLRPCTRGQNKCNSRKHKNNRSGYKGVYAAGKRWRAQIEANGKRVRLGRFDTPELAHEFYCLAADLLHGEFANYGI